MLTQESLKQILHYDHRSGIFHWLSNGKIAGTLREDGYILITVARKKYYAHRLAWLYVHGKSPLVQLDHIDHNKTNNSITNLREVSNLDNGRNQKRHTNNTSGVTGFVSISQLDVGKLKYM